MIKVHVTTMNPKVTIELETDDSDFEKFKKMLDYVVSKFQKTEDSSIKFSDNLNLPPISFTTSDEKLNTHMDL